MFALWILVYFNFGSKSAVTLQECDQMFIHTDQGPTKGSFSSPNFNISNYPADLQCIYTFVAKPNYRVQLLFNHFKLTGAASSCDGGDYLDIYAEMVSPEVDLIKQTLSGRYCGSVSPRIRISYHHVLVLILHSRQKSLGEMGFMGTYSFISSDRFKVGIPANPGVCGFTIDQAQHEQSGTITSPTYPGTYPRDLHCFYKLIGKPGQRVKLYFRDFDLYFGGEHCPYDSLTVYDGIDNRSPIIRRICGLQQKDVIYSVKNYLYIEFNSTNPPYAEHRGFELEYLFSKRFVDIGKLIGGQAGVSHIRGTQCDLRVQSNSRTKHIITSPNYPNTYPVNTTCIYILDGLQGAQDLEKVVVTFETFAITSLKGDQITECPYETYVGVTTSLKLDRDGTWDFEEPDLCGTMPEKHPYKTTVSEAPRLIILFKSEDDPFPETKSKGFKAIVKFETDFGIAGTPSSLPSLCDFTFIFKENGKKFRSFNSPRYPANYPLGKNCTYHLIGRPGKRVRVFFEQFALHKGKSVEDRCSDYVQLFSVFANGKEQLIGKYCPNNHPGPIVSAYDAFKMRVEFHADAHGTNTGFKAIYDFVDRETREIPIKNTDCGGMIEGSPGGWLASPHFPSKYLKGHICTWEIRVRTGYKVIVEPVEMDVEGAMATPEDPRINCQQAVIRFYPDGKGLFTEEFCGEDTVPRLISNSNVVRLSFITGPQKVNGLKGFNFTWTEVKKTDTDCFGKHTFRCKQSLFCIDESLRCNRAPNCGPSDHTDESNCFKEESSSTKTLILALSGTGLLVLLVMVIFCVLLSRHWARKARRKRHASSHRHSSKYSKSST